MKFTFQSEPQFPVTVLSMFWPLGSAPVASSQLQRLSILVSLLGLLIVLYPSCVSDLVLFLCLRDGLIIFLDLVLG